MTIKQIIGAVVLTAGIGTAGVAYHLKTVSATAEREYSKGRVEGEKATFEYIHDELYRRSQQEFMRRHGITVSREFPISDTMMSWQQEASGAFASGSPGPLNGCEGRMRTLANEGWEYRRGIALSVLEKIREDHSRRCYDP